MLPVVQRELRVAARNPKLYSRRLRWGVAQAVAACLLLLVSEGGFKTSTADWFFNTFSSIALVLCLFEGIRKTSDAISSEKREGTLGFLFLSTLSGGDVVLGKFTGAVIRSLSVLLPFLPILATSLLLGGTTLGEFWRVALALVSTLIASLALCLFVSVLSRGRSVPTAIVVTIIWVALPLIAGALGLQPREAELVSPIEVLRSADDLPYGRRPQDFWMAISFLWVISMLSLASASLVVPRVWKERPNKIRGQTSKRAKGVQRRRELLERNPVLWLSYDQGGRTTMLFVSFLLVVAGVLPPFGIWLWTGNTDAWSIFPSLAVVALSLLLWLRVSVHAASLMADSKNDGSLALLLSTPLTVSEVIKGYWLGFWQSFRIPIYCLLILLSATLLIGTTETPVESILWTTKVTLEVIFQTAVLAAVGMWMGLKAKTRAAAVVYTILYGGILPWIVCIFTFLIQIVLFLRALEQVKTGLKRMRSGGDTLGLQNLLPGPLPTQLENVPPVIR